MMENLVSNLKIAIEFLETYPNLARGSLLKTVVSSLEKSLEKFLIKAEELRLEQMPSYPEVAYLLEGEGKSIASVDFMRKFCLSRLGEKITITKSDKATRKIFLEMVAKAGKLSTLRDDLDPNKVYRNLFDELVKNDLPTIEKKLWDMKPNDLTGIVEANGLKAPKTATGKVSKTKKSIQIILSQIAKIKLVEVF